MTLKILVSPTRGKRRISLRVGGFYAPEIIHLAIIGALPDHVTLKSLKAGLPADWEEQKKFLRIE